MLLGIDKITMQWSKRWLIGFFNSVNLSGGNDDGSWIRFDLDQFLKFTTLISVCAEVLDFGIWQLTTVSVNNCETLLFYLFANKFRFFLYEIKEWEFFFSS